MLTGYLWTSLAFFNVMLAMMWMGMRERRLKPGPARYLFGFLVVMVIWAAASIARINGYGF